MIKINKPIQYKSMGYYIAKIQKADTPLGILLNVDYLTDLMDKELEKKRKVNY